MSQTKSFIILLLATIFACNQNDHITLDKTISRISKLFCPLMLIQHFNWQPVNFNITSKKYRECKFQSPK